MTASLVMLNIVPDFNGNRDTSPTSSGIPVLRESRPTLLPILRPRDRLHSPLIDSGSGGASTNDGMAGPCCIHRKAIYVWVGVDLTSEWFGGFSFDQPQTGHTLPALDLLTRKYIGHALPQALCSTNSLGRSRERNDDGLAFWWATVSAQGTLVIPARAGRASIQAFEQEVASNPNLVLIWTQPTDYGVALDRVSLLQALITWGRTAVHPTLRFSADTITKRQLVKALECDELLFGVALAATIERADGSDATDAVRQMLREELARRRVIADDNRHRTVILSMLEHRLSFSPDVMTRSPDGDTTDWTTRTMFHRVDVGPLSAGERKLIVGAREEIYHGPHRGAWLQRSSWPAEHPMATTTTAFTTVGQRLLRPTPAMLKDWQRKFPLDTTPADWLGQALWELFQNTEHHAIRSWGDPIPRAIRALIATPLQTAHIATNDASPVAAYIRKNAHTDFLAVSVVDSGDGLAYTAAARNNLRVLDRVDELAYFQRAVTGDARSPERPLHGFGMPIVGHLLTAMRGFIQIRSGSIVLYRDFGESEFTAVRPDSTPDWAFDLDAETEYRRWGSVVTIVLPRYGESQ